MVEGYSKTVEEIGKGFFEDENTKVRLMAIRLSDQFAGGEFIGDRFSGDSMAVRMRGGQLELPPEAEGLFANLSPDMVPESIHRHVRPGTEGPGQQQRKRCF